MKGISRSLDTNSLDLLDRKNTIIPLIQPCSPMRIIATMSTPNSKASVSPFLNSTQPIFLALCSPKLSAMSEDARQHSKFIHKGPLIRVLRHVMSHLYWPPSHVMTSQGLLTNTRYLLSDSSDNERLIHISFIIIVKF